jgi:exodeoxyribonuclease VII small subunit
MPPRAARGKGESEPEGFEAMLRELEGTVAGLESGDLGLDDALAAYERGVGLLGRCKGLLDAAERKVAVLTGLDEAGQVRSMPFDDEATVTPPPPQPPAGPGPEAAADGAGVRPPWED